MPMRARAGLSCLLALAIWTFRPSAHAEQPWSWPEAPKNLKVLPAEFTGSRLRPVMVGFTRALGVSCTHCHVGQEGQPLGTYDFASDQNPNKDRAREMYRMLGSVNEQLAKISPSGDQRVSMWCHTCHQGKARPQTLVEALGEAYRKAGVAGALARYRELREGYYGSGGYDFGEGSLNAFAYELLNSKDHDGAIAVFRLNASEFPKSGNVWDSLAEAYAAAGKTVHAEIFYRKSLEVDPQNQHAIEQLRGLARGAPGSP